MTSDDDAVEHQSTPKLEPEKTESVKKIKKKKKKKKQLPSAAASKKKLAMK
jgi:hypothetical protein